MRHPLYLMYGLTMLAVMSVAQFRGWSLSSLNQARVAPRSVRDNPGAYRSTYGGYSRYTGGK
jgi:hypothetical protein